MLTFDTHVKSSDAAQPRVTNVKTPIVMLLLFLLRYKSERETTVDEEQTCNLTKLCDFDRSLCACADGHCRALNLGAVDKNSFLSSRP